MCETWRGTWLTYRYDMTQLISFVHVTRLTLKRGGCNSKIDRALIHVWNMTCSYVGHDSFINVTWCDSSHSYMWHGWGREIERQRKSEKESTQEGLRRARGQRRQRMKEKRLTRKIVFCAACARARAGSKSERIYERDWARKKKDWGQKESFLCHVCKREKVFESQYIHKDIGTQRLNVKEISRERACGERQNVKSQRTTKRMKKKDWARKRQREGKKESKRELSERKQIWFNEKEKDIDSEKACVCANAKTLRSRRWGEIEEQSEKGRDRGREGGKKGKGKKKGEGKGRERERKHDMRKHTRHAYTGTYMYTFMHIFTSMFSH